MEFKKLDIKPEGNPIQRWLRTPHAKRTSIAIVIGAVAGSAYFYLTEGQHMATILAGDIIKSALLGGFLGFFITNSPCARGRC